MDSDARKKLAFDMAYNRPPQTNVAEKAAILVAWMNALGEPAEQALIVANNEVSAQSSLRSMLEVAQKNHDFFAIGDDTTSKDKTRIAKAHAAALEGLADKPTAPE